jgi:hypothetical protein
MKIKRIGLVITLFAALMMMLPVSVQASGRIVFMVPGSTGDKASSADIGTAGGEGFGVGYCKTSLLPENMSPMTGYDDTSSDNYGNYEYTNGDSVSVMVFIPRFYYKITAGTNTISIKGTDTYANEAAANVDSYALHRAFIDGDTEQAGFFIDKYENSKSESQEGYYIAASVDDGLPLSAYADHNPIADLTACSSNYYYEAVTAAHARDGTNGAVNASSIFHVGSRFQYAALAMLSLAHGQASSSTTYCAWYDATDNFPKGNNNNNLGDIDDSAVKWEGDGYGTDDSAKAGSAGYGGGAGNVFAKSTHNGQNCGVADLNGNMYEITIGMTAIASTMNISGISQDDPCQITVADTSALTTGDWIMITSITGMDELENRLFKITVVDGTKLTLADIDSSGYVEYTSGGTITYGTFYAAKEATAMKDFDSGTSNATDHWGATGVAAMMDEVTMSSLPFEQGGAFSQRYGSSTNQVLDEATSGDGWVLTGLGFPQDADGIDTTGTNQFGKDYFYQYIQDALCVRSGGYWGGGSYAGVWYVYLAYPRAHSAYVVSFRCACYPE